MLFLIYVLSAILVLDSLLLILLVLIQLPKKEAGAGLAFGGGATDALFGAGSGNVLTKVTKYATGIFFLLAMVLATMQSNYYHRGTTEFERAFERQTKQSPAQLPQSAIPGAEPSAPLAVSAGSNTLTFPPAESTEPPSTSAPAQQNP